MMVIHTNPYLEILINPDIALNPILPLMLLIDYDFSLETDGERLIYDSIDNLIEDFDREMLALESVHSF